MIKSFHSLPPEPSHTYLALDQELDGIIIRAVDRNGHDIESGILMKITEEGIQLHQALSAAVQVKTVAEECHRVRVFCHRYDELMTYREWEKKAPRHKCHDQYHHWLVHEESICFCDICGADLRVLEGK